MLFLHRFGCILGYLLKTATPHSGRNSKSFPSTRLLQWCWGAEELNPKLIIRANTFQVTQRIW